MIVSVLCNSLGEYSKLLLHLEDCIVLVFTVLPELHVILWIK